ncbi:MAG: DUF6011 domain-containing protein [Propionibacteriaceae bacterium]|jgi:hypothetical protein|nr:DUF6011 domain-containing protein [Propionibacteriaceae bacterium]
MIGEDGSRKPVFLDADVLAAPMSRTVLILASVAGARFVPRWSLAAEAEADRALRTGQTLVSAVRARFAWGTTVLVDTAPSQALGMVDTSETDRHIIAAARQAGIKTIVTRNVHDFGRADLDRLGMDAVHPDLFAATVLTRSTYQVVLAAMSASRLRPPNTPAALHAALGAGHPRLFEAMASLFPFVEAAAGDSNPPAEVFRGSRCLVCGEELSDPESLALGTGPGCRRAL